MASPIPGVAISTPFGVKGAKWSSGMHQGVDFACPVGTQILAPCDGKVVKVGNAWGPAFGNHQVLLQTAFGYLLFAHCSAYSVAVGQQVTKGQPIAKSGAEGNVTGPHLHMELQAKLNWVSAGGINPQPVLDA